MPEAPPYQRRMGLLARLGGPVPVLGRGLYLFQDGHLVARKESPMFWFKRCPRCHGDLADDRDQDGVYLYCLQCGWLNDPDTSGLEGSEAEDLERLRRWIFKSQELRLRSKSKPEARETRELAKEVEFEQPGLI